MAVSVAAASVLAVQLPVATGGTQYDGGCVVVNSFLAFVQALGFRLHKRRQAAL